ncbi:hypothetical protein LTR16_004903, partial [Cryomyces antarcticus]
MPAKGQKDTHHAAKAVKGGIVVAHLIYNEGWVRIGEIFHCDPSTAQRIFERARQRAGSQELLDILRNLDEHHPGPSELYPPGSEVSNLLKDTSQQDEIHQNLPHAAVIQLASQQLGFRIPLTTGERILHKHHEIFKYTPVIKPKLLPYHKAARVELAEWAIPKLERGDIFVFSDEMSVESKKHTQMPKVSRPKGSNPHDFKRAPPRTFQSFMFWGCIAIGYGTGPCH